MTSKPQKARKRKEQVKVREKRRQDKLAQRHRKRKDKRYNPGRYLTRKGKQQEGQVKLIGVKALGSFDQYGHAAYQKRINRKDFKPNPINVLVVTEWQRKQHKAGVTILTGLNSQPGHYGAISVKRRSRCRRPRRL